MDKEILVHKCLLPVESDEYEVLVYSRPDGSHVAKTVLDVYDVIINDGPTLDAVLEKHRQLLPLAINSRQLLTNNRKDD
jgi:hypothetical protein